ncbi:putative membrane protein [Streptomyces pristinaespiralis]
MSQRRTYRPPRALSMLREHLRETFWFAPTVALILVFVVWALADAVDTLIVDTLRDEEDFRSLRELMAIADDAKTIVTTIASAMMTFIGVVFSISLVAVQMAAGNFSPRVVRIFIRSRISKLTFSVFLSTFLLSLLVLTAFESERNPREVTSVPVMQSILTLLMVALSLLLFIAYVTQTLQLMKVGPVVDRVTREAFGALARMPRSDAPGEPLGAETVRISHQGRSGALRDVDVARLVRVARRHGVVLRLIPRVGDFVVPGTPVLTVHGDADHQLSSAARRALQSAVSVGVERTFRRDLTFGLRQLADIGLRAMSSSVNDPTTAVQCLDRIVQFLAVVSHRPLGTVYHQDGRGRVRLIQQVSGWDDLVDLGFAELRGCAVGSPQVTRRMMAGLEDLLQLVPPERRAPLERHREMLVRAVRQSVPDPAERDFALEPDRQGIG